MLFRGMISISAHFWDDFLGRLSSYRILSRVYKLQNFRAGNVGSGMWTCRKRKKKHKSSLQIPKKPSYTQEIYLEGNIFAQ